MLLPIELAFLLICRVYWYLLRKFCLKMCINCLKYEVTGHSCFLVCIIQKEQNQILMRLCGCPVFSAYACASLSRTEHFVEAD